VTANVLAGSMRAISKHAVAPVTVMSTPIGSRRPKRGRNLRDQLSSTTDALDVLATLKDNPSWPSHCAAYNQRCQPFTWTKTLNTSPDKQ
jgi:hypothetical protein